MGSKRLLLIVSPQSEDWVQAVRDKYDPQADQIPPAVELFSSDQIEITAEHLEKIQQEYELPKLTHLSFCAVGTTLDGQIWLMPDEQATEALQLWNLALQELFQLPYQSFKPHLFLGKFGEGEGDAAIDFTIRKISLPLVLQFDSLSFPETGLIIPVHHQVFQ